MTSNDAFFKTLQVDPIYETEDYFCSNAIWVFGYRYQSLYRHWVLSREYFKSHIAEIESTDNIIDAELQDIYSETAGVDIEYFPEYIRLSTVSIALSLIENMLNELSIEVAKDQGINVELSEKNIPYINKYILWFTRGCGIEIDIDKTHWKSLDAIRAVRNRFIHQIDRDIPIHVQQVISGMVTDAVEGGQLVSDGFVDVSLKKLAELAKNVELAHISYYQRVHKDN